ncbi:mechanosensitive ion channel protein 1/2/3 [Marchantia polymorpha subsp. ruderalis]|uniref:Mechanosensitive ion channel MscS domain-containing protein n=3 Tax=Marchantia polymorpha TaxID=3197 RepID=A0AAF6AQZ7_MARPO|nr:hypothetical protein MARPO_0001s0022 [Marchantia polymorpha]BBM98867.1 hypothetical protein Mp_1g16810 [Marchantia polymorpha subsp. ruderalis]|eukprot:PTQ49945.1 hypothetical protein MARPO_0001s0022 [Marchantia polymorpha]
MARSVTNMRSAIRRFSTRYQRHLFQQSLAAERSFVVAGNCILVRTHGSAESQKKLVNCTDTRSSPHTSSKNDVRGFTRCCDLRSSAWMQPSCTSENLIFRRGFTWGSKSEVKPPEDRFKETLGLLDSQSHDGVPVIEAKEAASVGSEWADKAYTKLMDGVKVVEEATTDTLMPAASKVLETYPIISEIATPVGVFTGAWIILPRVFRRLHGYVEQGSAVFSKGLSPVPFDPVPYEQTIWQAMELPSRLFATILTMLQVGRLIAPNAMAAEYLSQFWAGGGVLCIVWFLHNWKSNVLKRLLSKQTLSRDEREWYLTVDKISSLALVFIGALGLAEAYGLAINSLLTVGGIGGVATAFAAKDILGNVLTGVTISFSKPFSVGDQIKAGYIEGKVEEVGLHSTKLLNTEKNPIIVPNSFFQSQVIVNKSRAPWRAVATKIPIHLKDYEKVPEITQEIRAMLNRHPQVHLGEDKPRCSVAQFTPSSIEIAITCNVNPMSKDEFLLVEQAIVLESAAIISKFGAVLGGQV